MIFIDRIMVRRFFFIMMIATTSMISAVAQSIEGSPEYIRNLTAKWDGERFENGRPKVSDDLIERLKKVTIEESWAELMKLGYQNQYEGDWNLLHEREDAVLAGRVVTAQFMPMRPDLEDAIIEQGKREGRMWEQKRTDVHKYDIDVFVMGDDWQGKFDFLKEEGVEVVYLPRTPEISSTQIKNDLNHN